MEIEIRKFINFSLGIFKKIEESTMDLSKTLENNVNYLVKKGESANDEISLKVKHLTNSLFHSKDSQQKLNFKKANNQSLVNSQ